MNLKFAMALVLWEFLAVGCKDKANDNPSEGSDKGAPTTVPKAPDIVPVADIIAPPPVNKFTPYFFQGNSLRRLKSSNENEPVATFSKIRSCIADPMHEVFWLVDDLGVSLFDLRTQKKSPIVIAKKGNPIDAFEVRFGDGNGAIGNADGLSDMAAVVLMLTPAEVSIRPEVICEGNLSTHCFLMEEDEGDDPDLWEQTDELKSLVARYSTLRISNKEYLTKLAKRTTSVVNTSPDAPPLPAITLDVSACEEVPEDCGTGEYLGHGYWSILVGNSRGDFYHETYNLFDSKTREWVAPMTGKRATTPMEPGFSLAYISQNRTSILTKEGAWYSLRDNQHNASLIQGAGFCGFGAVIQ